MTERNSNQRIYTQCFSVEDANNLGYFIRSRGYEGVQNDSYRYCRLEIENALAENLRYGRNYCFVGVNGYRLVVGKSKREMSRQGSTQFVKKQRVFRYLLEKI